MKLSKSAEKLEKYRQRLSDGKADEIKLSHVERMIEKIKAKKEKLQGELGEAESDGRRERLQRKIEVAEAQLENAAWLMKELGTAG